MPDPFEKRIHRANALAKEWPFAADLLRFFNGLFALQNQLLADLHRSTVPTLTIHDTLHVLPSLLGLVESQGPESLQAHIGSLRKLEREDWARASVSFLKETRFKSEGSPQEFFTRVLLEPMLYVMRKKRESPPGSQIPPTLCACCGGRPIVSLLREDKSAETVRRSLVCWLCNLEWDFPRVLCPSCREERPEKLPRYAAQEIPWMRVEGCDSCGKYIKSVDLSLNWEAEPVVDELASTPLDVIAAEHAYTKITTNLAGL